MRRTGSFFILFAFVLATFACGEGGANTSSKAPAEQSVTIESLADSDAAEPAKTTTANTAIALSPTGNAKRPTAEKISLEQGRNSMIDTAPTDRKIIRNAELSLETDSPEQTQQSITSIAENNGGFVVESQQSSSDVRSSTRDIVSMSVRVPAQKFGDVLDQIRRTSKRVVFETVKGDDVTEEFIDVEARLKAKKALEQQFVEIMKRANSVQDALNVQSELAGVRAEIEKIEGRKRFLENQANLSTIKMKLQSPVAFAASSSGFSEKLGQSFGTGFDFALNIVLGLVTFVIAVLPFALFIGLPGFLIIRYLIRRQSKPRSVGDIVREEIVSN